VCGATVQDIDFLGGLQRAGSQAGLLLLRRAIAMALETSRAAKVFLRRLHDFIIFCQVRPE
jgi:hypothetical protein